MKNVSTVLYWLIAILLAWFAYFSFDNTNIKWSWVGVAIYLAPLCCLLLRIQIGRYSVFVFSIFIVLQAAIPSMIRGDYFRNEPNFKKIIYYEKDAIKGFSEGDHHISVDHMGNRTTKPVDYENPAPGIRVFTIGGSTTHMIDIDDHRTWSHHLQEELTKNFNSYFEVINTGLAGTRAEQNLGTLKHITRYNPDLAIILVGTNDWRRHILNEALGIKGASPSYPWENFSLRYSYLGRAYHAFKDRKNREELDSGKKEVERLRFHFNPNRDKEIMEKCNQGITVNLPPDFPQKVSDSFSNALQGMYKTCAKAKLTCVLLTQPHGYQPSATGIYRRDLSCNNRWSAPNVPLPPGVVYVLRDIEQMGRVATFYNNYTKDFGRKVSMPVCDLAAKIEPTSEMFYDEVHFTEKGTKKVAAEIFKCIKSIVEEKQMSRALK